MKHALIIGAGYAGLSSALLLQRDGWTVTILENNDGPGGRARLWSEKGYHFDMGPSWYLMPEVFERFFKSVNADPAKVLSLTKLKTHYKVFFEGKDAVRVTDNLDATKALYESFEKGGAQKLTDYMKGAEEKYDIALGQFLYKEYKSIWDFFNWQVLTKGLRMGIFQSLAKFVNKYFTDVRSKQILEYSMVFLGTSPSDAPSMYTLMSHVDLKLGVWFPKGGMNGVAVAMADLFTARGGTILYHHDVTHLDVTAGRVTGVVTAQKTFTADVVLNSGDYAWGETKLLDAEWQTYREPYWKKRVVAPSMFIVYLGINKTLPGLEHHNLYFSTDWDKHFDTIFKTPSWPENPCYYLSAITKTDTSMAPAGCENLFLLVPAAPGLDDPDTFREAYLAKVLAHVEATTGESLRDSIEVCRVFSQRDFARDYHAFQGTALGLAHTLFQTAIFRPAHRSKKVSNLWYSGQYTHPGVGVPMTLIASDIVAGEIRKAERE